MREAQRERGEGSFAASASSVCGEGGGGGLGRAGRIISQVLDLGLVAKEGGREALDLLPI